MSGRRAGELACALVLVRISPTLQRPFLVLCEDGVPELLTGVLFVDPNDYQCSEWLRRAMPGRATQWQPYHFVRGICRGAEVGQWEPRPADTSGAELVAAEDKGAARVPARRRA